MSNTHGITSYSGPRGSVEGLVEGWTVMFDSANWLNRFFYMCSIELSASIRHNINFNQTSEGLAKYFHFLSMSLDHGVYIPLGQGHWEELSSLRILPPLPSLSRGSPWGEKVSGEEREEMHVN